MAIQREGRQKDDVALQPKRCPNQSRHWCGCADLVFLEKNFYNYAFALPAKSSRPDNWGSKAKLAIVV